MLKTMPIELLRPYSNKASVPQQHRKQKKMNQEKKNSHCRLFKTKKYKMIGIQRWFLVIDKLITILIRLTHKMYVFMGSISKYLSFSFLYFLLETYHLFYSLCISFVMVSKVFFSLSSFSFIYLIRIRYFLRVCGIYHKYKYIYWCV